VREAIWTAAPDLPIDDLSPVNERIRSSMAAPRFYLALIGTFAVAALLLATGGIYGTLLYGVRIRQRELDIRLALGARTAQVVRMIVVRGMLLVAAGLVLGVAASIAASRALTGLLFEVSNTDPRTIAAVSFLLGAVALVACWVPACKAGRTDPMRTLRTE
jgi:ABC-type antimicrobial peptide transport system permease subunit